MANIKSAKKRIKITEFKTAKNKRIKSIVKTAVRRFEDALAAGNLEDAQAKLSYTDKKMMQAVAKGTFHKNTAARKISQLTRRLNEAKNKAI